MELGDFENNIMRFNEQQLVSGPVALRYVKSVGSAPEGQTVPLLHFAVLVNGGQVVGHINFKIGNTPHILQCAGHIGYEIHPAHRGASFAYHASQALAPVVKMFYPYIILTSDPANTPSIRTIEKLGAAFIDEVDVPPEDPSYRGGARVKRRYRWSP